MDAYLFAKWIDPRLAFTPSGSDDQERNYAFGQIWIPQLEMINAATPRERYDTSIRVAPDGTVRYAERCKVGLSSKFALRRFPFDRAVAGNHNSSVPGRWTSHQVQAGRSLDLDGGEFESYSSLAQWRVQRLSRE